MNHLFAWAFVITGFLFSISANISHAAEANDVGCAIAGPADAPVTIEEFADLECPFCARGSNTVKQVLKDYPNQVRLIFHNMPLRFHPHAQAAAKAFTAVCLQSAALAYSFQEEMFERQPELEKRGEAFLFEVAAKIGADVPKMKAEMNGAEVANILAADQQAASAHGLKGTPNYLIGSAVVRGAYPYSEFKKIIDRQLRNESPIQEETRIDESKR